MRMRQKYKTLLLAGALCGAGMFFAAAARADDKTIDEIFGNDETQQQDARIPPVDEYNDVPSGVLLDNPKKVEKKKDKNIDQVYETTTHRLNYDAILDLYNKGDYKKVAENLLPLAESGHHGAEELIGIMYHQGQGVPQDFDKALKYLRRSADADRPLSEHHLATMYYLGQGVPKDPVTALMWLHIAIVHYPDGPAKDRAEQDRDNIYTELSRRDKDRAMDMTRKWLADKGEAHLLDLQ
jgi:TPR repeat protein